MRFPLSFVPSISYKGGNGFGGNRDKVRMGLKHAANDLAALAGTPVLSMDEGVVLRGPYRFFFNTYALEVQHPQFIARYCEIAPVVEAKAKVGDILQEGQVIAYIGNQPGRDMLHIEFFTGELTGDLSYETGHPPYGRRADVFNGVEYLDQTIHTTTHTEGNNKYRYFVDSEGRKFIETATRRWEPVKLAD